MSGNLVQKAEPVSEEEGGVLFCRTAYIYDEDGRQTGILFDSGKWTLVEDGTERRLEEAETGKILHLSFSYDARGRLVQAEDGNGACIRYEYDVRGNKTKEEQVISEDVTKTICFRYDRAGRLSEKKELIAGWAREGFEKSVQAAVTIYGRDANGNLTEIRRPEGCRIFREYDLRDRLVCERMVDEKNGIDRSTLVSYDRAGNVVSLCRKGADGRETEIVCHYDLKDRLVQAGSMEGAVFEYHYDRNDHLVEERRPCAGHDAGTGTWNYQYDGMGRLTERRGPDGQREEWNQYDAMGRRTVQKLADGEEFHFRYDMQGALSSIGSVKGRGEGRKLQSYRYNSRGQVVGIEDGNGNKTGFDLDAWGKLTRVRAADRGEEQYTYDYAGNITSTTDAEGGTIHYRYNSQGKVCEITDQEGLKERFYYDREGRQTLSIDRLGNRVETRYNIDGNPVRRISSDKDGKNREVRVWEYDCLGYLKEAVGGGFRYRYEYRPDGKLLCKETSGGAVVRYTYYPDGSVKTMADGSGRVLSYGYDRGGRLVSIADGSGEIVGYCHTREGR
ncbi:RHS repeat protein [bacterium D16-54]|nr:RHS repeat protein [bacterium D16-54]RKJ09961.1 RHS repeat protein [bacterium D16-56]